MADDEDIFYDSFSSVEEEEEENVFCNTKSTLDSDDYDSDSSDDAFSMSENQVLELTKNLPQSTDQTSTILDEYVDRLPTRWKNYVIRAIFGALMISGFAMLIYLGPLALLLLLFIIEAKCFTEILCVGNAIHKGDRFSWFHPLSWYTFIVANYYFFGQILLSIFDPQLNRFIFILLLVSYHKFVSFSLYIGGLGFFAYKYTMRHTLSQFSLLCWINVVVVFLSVLSHLAFQNLLKGLIWVIVPSSMVICNDIMAYFFGFFFGKTPLIQLSPKKTWEGYIGGGISTIVFGVIISHILSSYPYFVCPVAIGLKTFEIPNCAPSALFQPQYEPPFVMHFIFEKVGFRDMVVCPFVLHSLSLSLFCSIIAPFGGFFASGFKRAFKVKDFGNIIPGHGGAVDRFDCHFLTFSFTYAYVATFIDGTSMQQIWIDILHLSSEEQLSLLLQLNDTLFLHK